MCLIHLNLWTATSVLKWSSGHSVHPHAIEEDREFECVKTYMGVEMHLIYDIQMVLPKDLKITKAFTLVSVENRSTVQFKFSPSSSHCKCYETSVNGDTYLNIFCIRPQNFTNPIHPSITTRIIIRRTTVRRSRNWCKDVSPNIRIWPSIIFFNTDFQQLNTSFVWSTEDIFNLSMMVDGNYLYTKLKDWNKC